MKHCTSCGSPIPNGQGKSCSMCYGDPAWGRDGYYQHYLDEQARQAEQDAVVREEQDNG